MLCDAYHNEFPLSLHQYKAQEHYKHKAEQEIPEHTADSATFGFTAAGSLA